MPRTRSGSRSRDSPWLHALEDPTAYGRMGELLARDDLILCAGAGLSAHAQTTDGRQPPLWAGFLTGMVHWCQRENVMSADHGAAIVELVRTGELLLAGDEIERIVAGVSLGNLQRCVADVLLYESARLGDAHRAAARLPFRGFLTTNFDDHLENAFVHIERRSLPRFYADTVDGLLDHWRQHRQFILKLHGDVSQPGSLVIGQRSYDRAMDDEKPLAYAVKLLIGASSLLIVGYGGRDPHLQMLLRQVARHDGRSKRHWMVAHVDTMPELRARDFWDQGINVITYEGPHTKINEFFRRLARAYETSGRVAAAPPAVATVRRGA